jgi:hypothetical protein
MPKYDIYVVCDQCGQPHPVNVKIQLEDEGLDRTLHSEHFGDRPLPAEIIYMQTNKYRCPYTKQLFSADDPTKAVLFSPA